ncbi:MAG: adenylate cyclase [Rhodobacterales bacterium 32-66-7]|nr:MAG: adenylate cyclase [Rhodobacterales bacterium 32-66-7]
MQFPDPTAFLYSLPVFAEFADVADTTRYRPMPEGWALAVADVVSSGRAIAEGKYKLVNMGGAAVITAVLNAMGQRDYPFVFGGDGAAIAVPPGQLDAARQALAAVARWIAEDLGLEMRTALCPVADIRAAGRDVQVARMRASEDMTFAMFAGGGLAWAEAEMKQGRFAVPMAPPGTRPDLSGLSCRWNPVQAVNGKVVSVIVVPGPKADDPAFRALVAEVVAIANTAARTGNPLPEAGPRPVFHLGGMDAEAKAQSPPGKRFKTRLGVIIAVILTVILHRTNLTIGGFNARDYSRAVMRNSDFRKFDDGLKMTIDVTAADLARIEALLDRATQAGICRFGLHQQASALITCIVPSLQQRDHMHFVDGADGGYAQAALVLKAKVAAETQPATGLQGRAASV